MSGHHDRQLKRLLRDNASEQEAVRLLRSWQSLELAEPAPAPLGFADRVLAQAHSRRSDWVLPSWWGHTTLGRLASVAVLAVGIVGGALMATSSQGDEWTADVVVAEPTLAESYWAALDESAEELLQEVQP